MQPELTSAERKKLKARAQRLKPLVKLGKAGMTEAFMTNLDKALADHELVKGKFDEFKDQKKELAPQIAEKSGSALVATIGNVFVLFRPKPAEEKKRTPA
jgi:RNA-binding protein